MEVVGGEPVATVHTAMAEVGQGGVTVHAQIARTELGVTQVTIHPADTQVGSAGSTSASRQTYVTGGAVKNACELVREEVLEIGRRKFGSYHPAWATAELLLEGGKVVTDGGEVLGDLVDVLEGEAVEVEEEWRHRPTEAFDLRTGQGNGDRPVLLRRAPRRRRGRHRTRPGQGHRTGLRPGRRQGAQPTLRHRADPGRHHPGHGHRGDGRRSSSIPRPRGQNPSFTDYLLPTILDTPTIPVDVLELADDHALYGLRGIGEGTHPVVDSGGPRGRPERDRAEARPHAGTTGASDRYGVTDLRAAHGTSHTPRRPSTAQVPLRSRCLKYHHTCVRLGPSPGSCISQIPRPPQRPTGCTYEPWETAP